MTLQEGIEKLKALLFTKDEPIVTTEQSFKDAKLEDGVTIIRYEADALATGVVVSLIDESGQVLPLPKGDYVLEDGTTFSIVDDLGTADNVVLAEEKTPEQEDEMPAMPKEEMPMQEAPAASAAPAKEPKRVIKSQVEEHVFNAFKDEVAKTISELTEKLSKVELENVELKKQIESGKEINKEMFALVEKMSNEPVKQPTETIEKFNAVKYLRESKEARKQLEAKMTADNLK